MITVRKPEDIYLASGLIQDGTFLGRWHFSFGDYYDPASLGFGSLRVFNDDTLTPGAVWPLHPHRDIEVVTVCAEGEFRHADQNGVGGVLKKGWVQHTTVGKGMLHSEINNRQDAEMRFLQLWFLPEKKGLEPSVEQRPVERKERTDRLLPLVSNEAEGALRIRQDAEVFASHLSAGASVEHSMGKGRGAYLYVVEGGPVGVQGMPVKQYGAAKVLEEASITVTAKKPAELLLVDVAVPGP